MRSSSLAVVMLAGVLAGQAGDRKDPPGTVQAAPAVEAPPAPPLSPDDALVAFDVLGGYRIELVAAEPLVEAPVAIAFDAEARLWVVEMRGYMRDPDGTDEEAPTGRIAVLEDDDGDGRMDRRTTFLDGIALPRGVLPVAGGALVLAPPRFTFWRDTDGDGVADEERDLGRTFREGIENPEHAANTPRFAPDNTIRFALHDAALRIRNGDFSWEPVPAAGQWGLAFDDFGRAYFNTNSDWLRAHLAPARYALRNQNVAHPAFVNQRVGHDQTVWPSRVTPGVNRAYRDGVLREDGTLARFTAVCAPCIYRGDALPELRGDVFVAEPAAHLIRRGGLREQATTLSARNAYEAERREFLTSSDERFRPVGIENGPDGALWVVDMYRGLIQHRNFLTSYLRDQVEQRGLSSPVDCGRIWRIVPEEGLARRARGLAGASAAELVQALEASDGWTRDTAQRLLVERGARSVARELRALASGDGATAPRLHALWTLDGLGALDRATVLRLLRDDDPEVRALAVRLAERWLRVGDGITAACVAGLAGREDVPRVRLQIAASLGETDTGGSAGLRALVDDTFVALLDRDGADPRCLDAAISGLGGREAAFVHLLAERGGALSEARADALARLAECAFRGRRPADLEAVLATAVVSGAEARRAILAGIERALPVEGARPIPVPSLPPSLDGLLAIEDAAATAIAAALEVVDPAEQARRQTAAGGPGEGVYGQFCAACHQPDGLGLDGLAPPLRGSEWVLGPPSRLVRIVLHGVTGPIDVAGRTYDLQAMPEHGHLDDARIAALATWLRSAWDHAAAAVEPDAVRTVREVEAERTAPWTQAELEALR